MIYNYAKLKGRIKELYGTQDAFAAALEMSAAALSARLNNTTSFTQGEMDKACQLLSIADGDIRSYFFCHGSSDFQN
jgi:hypothetical protein